MSIKMNLTRLRHWDLRPLRTSTIMNLKLTHLKFAPTLLALLFALGCSKQSPDEPPAKPPPAAVAAPGPDRKSDKQVALETLAAIEAADQRVKSITSAIDVYDVLVKEAGRLQEAASAEEIAVANRCIRTLLRLEGYLARLKAVEELGPLVTDPLNQRARDEIILIYYKNIIEVLALERDGMTEVEEIAAPVLRTNAGLAELVKTLKELFAIQTQLFSLQKTLHGKR
jgi:hypothetical protein